MFSENKYKKCINHLVGVKTSIVMFYTIVFAVIGGIIGFEIMRKFINEPVIIVIVAALGLVIGLIIGLGSIWRVEIKIQEAYWRIDILNELKKQNSTKNVPLSKTVIAIENRQVPHSEDTKTEVKSKAINSDVEVEE